MIGADQVKYVGVDDDSKGFFCQLALIDFFIVDFIFIIIKGSGTINFIQALFSSSSQYPAPNNQTWKKWWHLGIQCPEGFEATEGLCQFQLNSSGNAQKTTLTEGFQLLGKEIPSV